MAEPKDGGSAGLGFQGIIEYMGYDFTIVSIRDAAARRYPLKLCELTKADLENELPWTHFREWLLRNGGRINGGINSVLVEYPNGESINFSGDCDSIYLDTHARWEHVLAALRALCRLHENARILNWQSGQFYDQHSFEAFMAGK